MGTKYVKQVTFNKCLDDQCKVELWDFSRANENEAARMEAATLVSTACYEKESALNKKKLYDEFVKKCQTPLEFIREGSCNPGAIGESFRNKPGLPTFEGSMLSDDTMRMENKVHKSKIACFRLTIPLETVGHFVRHRSFSFMQTSRRYTKVTPESFFITPDFDEDEKHLFKHMIAESMLNYRISIQKGHKLEVARRWLPSYALLTTLWVMGEIDGLANFFKLRLDSHAQKETREVAEVMARLLEVYQPQLWTAIQEVMSGE